MSSSLANMNIYWISTVLLIGIPVSVNGKIKIIEGDNPGSCGKSTQGAQILIQDRQNKQKLLICTKDNETFGWKTADGSRTLGEFFSPGYDCSAILDADPKAKSGLYWIKLNGLVPKKVWCDMNTDGGGFMLVGRKNSSITWTVPSNNITVTPFGYPHWSSALGEAPILDFRVQVATAEDFKTTKAHWFYRLRNKRQLKNLMVLNKGGCDKYSPGIGDVAYVKDLQTEKIATTQFRCSKFGVVHHPRTMFGWMGRNNSKTYDMERKQREAARTRGNDRKRKEKFAKCKTLYSFVLGEDIEMLKQFEAWYLQRKPEDDLAAVEFIQNFDMSLLDN